MRRTSPTLRLACALALATPLADPRARPATAQSALEAARPALEARIATHHGTVGLAAIDLRTGTTLAIRGDQPFPAASVIKVPVLVELFHQVRQGRIRLEDPLVLLEADKKPGSGILQFLAAPHQLTVRDAAFLMIALSDNTATNLILDKIGIRSVAARMDSLGLPHTRIFRKVFSSEPALDPDSAARYGLGVTTPLEMARLFALLYRGEAVSPEASREMLALLKAQFSNDRIPRLLPAGTEVAHKDGSLDATRNDCGIVFTPGHDYVLCIFTTDNRDRSWRLDNEAHLLIAELARIVHQAVAATPAE